MIVRRSTTFIKTATAIAAAGALAVGGAVAMPAAGAAPAASATSATSAATDRVESGHYLDARQATEVAVQRTPPSAVGPWSIDSADTSAYDPAQRLSAIVLSVQGATVSSPQQVALFHHDLYIGTTTFEAYPYQSVQRVVDNVIHVDYRYLRPGDPNAAPSGTTWSNFTLFTDGSVVMDGETPP